MAAAPVEIDPTYNPDGFEYPKFGHCVPMSYLDRIQIVKASDDVPVWTSGMSDCCAVVIYDRLSQDRSFVHIQGGDVTDADLDKLAPSVTAYSTIILAAGRQYSENFFTDFCYKNLKEKIVKALKRAEILKDLSHLKWRCLDEKPNNGTLVIMRTGRYGQFTRVPSPIDIPEPLDTTKEKCCIIS